MSKKTSNKGISAGEWFWRLIYILVTIAYLHAFYSIFMAGAEVQEEGFERTRGRIDASANFGRVVSSPNCLSTGEMGVLNKTLLEGKNGTEVLECSYHPALWEYIEVENLENGKKYYFGAEGASEKENREMGVDYDIKLSIEDCDGNRELAEGSFYYRHNPDPVTRLSEAAHIAIDEGIYLVTLENPNKFIGAEGSYEIEVENNKIIDENGYVLPLRKVEIKEGDDHSEAVGDVEEGKIVIPDGSSRSLHVERSGVETVKYQILG